MKSGETELVIQSNYLMALGSDSLLHPSPQLSLSNLVGQMIKLKISQVTVLGGFTNCWQNSPGKCVKTLRVNSKHLWHQQIHSE